MILRREIKDKFGTIKKFMEETDITIYDIKRAEAGDPIKSELVRNTIEYHENKVSKGFWTKSLTKKTKKEIVDRYGNIKIFCQEKDLKYYSVLDVLRGTRDRVSGLGKEILDILEIKY